MEECQFDKNWKTRKNGNSWNSKDTLGLVMLLLLSIIILNLFLLFVVSHKKIPLFTIIICIVILCVIIFKYPISVIYPVSAIISTSTRTPEFVDRFEYFPNCEYFEDPKTFKTIQNELEKFMEKTDNGHKLVPTSETFGKENKEIGSGGGKENKWRLFQIKVLGSILPGAEDNFPTVVALCKQFPEILACVVSVLEPNVIIPSHVGYMKGIIRYMLPLKIPKDKNNLYLCVNKLKYNWEEGVGVAWDDCYPHMVVNNTDETRVVIYFDIKRKGLSKFESKLLDISCKIVEKSPVIKEQMSQQEKQIKQF